MINEQVATWLNSDRDYAQGLILLKELQPGSLTVIILDTGDDEFNQILLTEELIKHAVSEGVPTVLANAVERGENIHHSSFNVPVVTSGINDPPITEVKAIAESRDNSADAAKRMRLKKEAGQLWKEMAHVKGAMSKVRPGKALMRLSRQLIQLNEKRQNLWDEIDFFNEYGYWHDEKKITVEKPVNLEQLIKNQMSYRTKAQKMLERPLTLSQRQYQEARILSINIEIDRLKSLREGEPDVV